MKFSEVVEQVRAWLQRQGRVSYRALRREFDLDDDYLQDLKDELIDAQRVASDEDGKVLVWVGASPVSSSTFQVSGSTFQVEESPKSEVRGPESEAEECFLKAIEIACKQQAKSLELRAVMSLSRLWQSQGKKEEAHRMLAKIYGWFTEGFDTKDLQEAKALLEELSH
jgi:hypothetical protein